MMSVAAPTRPVAEPSAGALPSARTVPSRRTSQPPLPSGRIATSTTAFRAGLVTGGVYDGQVVDVVAGAVVVVDGNAGPEVVVVFGRVVLVVPGRLGLVEVVGLSVVTGAGTAAAG